MSAELEASIPAASDTPARLGRIEATLQKFEGTLDEIKRALLGGLDGAPGIYQRLGGHESALKDHEDRITTLEDRADKGRDKTGDRVWILVLGGVGAAIAQVIGYLAHTAGGKHP